jgi:hypothetical protein
LSGRRMVQFSFEHVRECKNSVAEERQKFKSETLKKTVGEKTAFL